METQNQTVFLAGWSTFNSFFYSWAAVQSSGLLYYSDFACSGCGEFNAGKKVTF